MHREGTVEPMERFDSLAQLYARCVRDVRSTHPAVLRHLVANCDVTPAMRELSVDVLARPNLSHELAERLHEKLSVYITKPQEKARITAAWLTRPENYDPAEIMTAAKDPRTAKVLAASGNIRAVELRHLAFGDYGAATVAVGNPILPTADAVDAVLAQDDALNELSNALDSQEPRPWLSRELNGRYGDLIGSVRALYAHRCLPDRQVHRLAVKLKIPPVLAYLPISSTPPRTHLVIVRRWLAPLLAGHPGVKTMRRAITATIDMLDSTSTLADCTLMSELADAWSGRFDMLPVNYSQILGAAPAAPTDPASSLWSLRPEAVTARLNTAAALRADPDAVWVAVLELVDTFRGSLDDLFSVAIAVARREGQNSN